ncbi:MAG: shikimate kinase [Bacteroidetes bacterium]|nr:shikimate kinase [Bacteroidota bacterium]
MRVFLIGFMGSGKSKKGRKLATQLGFEFVDMDEWVEKQAGKSIPQIFQEMGEDYFRTLEFEALLKISQKSNVVVSTGGGSPCYFNAIDKMNENGISIYLKGSPAFLRERLLESKKKRPLIENLNAEELLRFIEAKLTERATVYQKATYTVEALGLRTKELFDIVLEAKKSA